MIDSALLLLIIANNPGIEINIKLSPADYCRKYPQDYLCNPRRYFTNDFRKNLQNYGVVYE